MATQAETKAILEEWREHCKRVQSFTDTTVLAKETDVERDRRKARLLKNYAAFCEYYFPHFLALKDKTTGEVVRVIHNAPFHNEAARLIKATPNLKAVFKWPRGHAKSTHMDIFVPLWLMFQPKPLIRFMVVVGKSEDAAIRLLSDIQAELEFNQRLLADFGNQKSLGDWTEGEFTTESGVHFLACGRGQSPRGLRNRESRPDYIVIDDLDDDELCRNPSRVREMTDWVTDALFGSLDVGRGRFIMVGNLIGKDSVLAKISAKEGVHVSMVYAVDKNGDPVWKEKWTRKEAEEYAKFVGYRSWQKEMMHNPIQEGRSSGTSGSATRKPSRSGSTMPSSAIRTLPGSPRPPTTTRHAGCGGRRGTNCTWLTRSSARRPPGRWFAGCMTCMSACRKMHRSVSSWRPTSSRTPSWTNS